MAAHMDGHPEVARAYLTESTDLRRQIEFTAGVAANLVALAHIAHKEGRHAEARARLDEAESLAGAAGAAVVLQHVREASSSMPVDG